MPSDQFQFAAEDAPTIPAARDSDSTWKVLLVDDDPDIHNVTRLALAGLEHAGKPLELHSANSAQQASELLRRTVYAVALIDVVMERDEAGLDLVRHIRETLGEPRTRLIIRTGQPGLAPAWDTVRDFDINGYEEKSFQTATRLKTAVLTALRSFEQICALEQAHQRIAAHRENLGRLLAAPADKTQIDRTLLLRTLVQLVASGRDAVLVERPATAPANGQSPLEHLRVITACGAFAPAAHQGMAALPATVTACLARSIEQGADSPDCVFAASTTGDRRACFIDHQAAAPEIDKALIRLFCQQA